MSKQSRKLYLARMDQKRKSSILATAYTITPEEHLRDETRIKQAMHKWGLNTVIGDSQWKK